MVRISGNIVQESNIVRSGNQIQGVRAAEGVQEVEVINLDEVQDAEDIEDLPERFDEGDHYIQVDNQLVKLTLNRPASREQLLSALQSSLETSTPEQLEFSAARLRISLDLEPDVGNRAELEEQLESLDQQIAENDYQEVAAADRDIGEIQRKIARRNMLGSQLSSLRHQRGEVEDADSGARFTITNEQGQPERISKREYLSYIDSQIAEIQPEYRDLVSQDLETRQAERYTEAVENGGPIQARLRQIDQDLEQLTEQFNHLQDSGAPDEQLQEVGQQIRAKILEGRELYEKMQSWSTGIEDIETVNRLAAGENITQSQTYLNAFLSQSGMTSIGVIDWSSSTISRNIHNSLGYIGTIEDTLGAIEGTARLTRASAELLGLGANVSQRVLDAFEMLDKAAGGAMTTVLRNLPEGMRARVGPSLADFLGNVGARMGPEAAEKFITKMGAKLGGRMLAGAGTALAAYGAGYYGGIATGLIYPDVEFGEGDERVKFEVRPSSDSRMWAGIAASIDAAAVAAGAAVTVGSGGTAAVATDLALGGISMIFESIAEFHLAQDAAQLQAVHNNLTALDPETATPEEVREGIRELRSAFGGDLSGIHEFLGEVQIHEDGDNSGDIVTVNEQDDENHVDRQMAGTVLTQIVDFGVNGQLSPQEVQDLLNEVIGSDAEVNRQRGSDEEGGVMSRSTSDDDVMQSFVNQMRLRFGEPDPETGLMTNPQGFREAMDMLGSDVRLKAFKSLSDGWTTTSTTFIDESYSDLSEFDVMKQLVLAETDPGTRGNMVAFLFDGYTGGNFEDMAFEIIQETYNVSRETGNFGMFKAVLDGITLDAETAAGLLNSATTELSSERAGQIMAWMVEAGADTEQIRSYIQSASTVLSDFNPGNWFTNDNITSAFVEEMQRMGNGSNERLTAMRDIVPQEDILTLFRNLENGNTSDGEYANIEALAFAATPETKATMLNEMMDWATYTRAEEAISQILVDAPPAEFRQMVDTLNMSRVASELENTAAFNNVLMRLNDMGLDSAFSSFIRGASDAQLTRSWSAMSWEDAGTLSNDSRDALMKEFIEADNFGSVRQLIDGNPGAGMAAMSGAERTAMMDYLSNHVGDFSRDEALEATAYILANGSQSQIENAFREVRQDFNWGNGADIVRQVIGPVIENAQENGWDISGKLSASVLQDITRTADNNWDRIIGQIFTNEYDTNMAFLEDLAGVLDTDGKANIIRTLMDGDSVTGWTPGRAENAIAAIFRDTTDPAEFTDLVDQIGAADISNELEQRGDLGRVMAYIVDRYEGNADSVLQTIMDQWSNTSIKCDDYLHNMIVELQNSGNIGELRDLNNTTLGEMADWLSDTLSAYRDGNVFSRDAETVEDERIIRSYM